MIFVELIFTLPLLLLFVWFFMYIGVIYNAKTSLISAMENSLRTGMVRGYLSITLDHRMLYDKIDDLCNHIYESTLDGLLFSNANPSGSERASMIAAYDKTTEHWTDWVEGVPNEEYFCNQPLHNIYAILFTEQAMKKSLGAAVNFPCDPHDDASPSGGAGCLRCIPLNPCTMEQTSPGVGSTSYCDTNTIYHRVALFCEYRPASVFVEPIDALIKILTGKEVTTTSTVSYQAYYDIPMDFDWNFEQ